MKKAIFTLSFEKYSTLTELEVEFFNFVNQNAEGMVNKTIKEISNEAFISPASIVRFCKKMGYNSFSEFKYDLKNKLCEKNETPDTGTQRKFLLEQMRTEIIEAFEMLDMDQMLEIAPLLYDSQVLLYGKGTNEYFINYLTTRLSLMGLSVIAHRDSTIAHIYAEKMKRNGVVFMLSSSGETQTTLNVALSAKQNGCKIIVVTQNPQSSLAKMSDYCLLLPKQDLNQRSYENIDLRTQFTTVWLLDVLIQQIALYRKTIES